MNTTTKKMGLTMSVLALLSFVIYTVCFTAILFVNEPFVWSDIGGLAAYEAANQTVFKYVGMACMMIFSIAFLVMILCWSEGLDKGKRIHGKMASFLALAFCITICINYFVQITSTRLQLQTGMAEGLAQFTQSFNLSALNGINMLGWTLFYGLSSLAIAFAFDGSRLGKASRYVCIANAAMMFCGLIGYALNDFALLLVTMNLGLGAAGIGVIVCFLLGFRAQPVKA